MKKAETIQCSYCQREITPPHGFVQITSADGVELRRYICSDCKARQEKRSAPATPRYTPWWLVGLIAAGAGIVSIVLMVSVALLLKSYYWYYVFGMGLLLIWAAHQWGTIYSFPQKLVYIVSGAISYIISVEGIELINALQQQYITIEQLFNTKGLALLFWHLPLTVVTDGFHLIAIVLFAVMVFRFMQGASVNKVRYQTLKV